MGNAPAPAPARPEVAEALHRLSLLHVAKDLFLSEWYFSASRSLFGKSECEKLERISRESQEEAEATRPLAREWAQAVAQGDESTSSPREIARSTRRDFLHTLIEVKDAAGELYEMAALLAPPHLREHFLELAAIDFRHASELRDILKQEVPTVPHLLGREPRV